MTNVYLLILYLLELILFQEWKNCTYKNVLQNITCVWYAKWIKFLKSVKKLVGIKTWQLQFIKLFFSSWITLQFQFKKFHSYNSISFIKDTIIQDSEHGKFHCICICIYFYLFPKIPYTGIYPMDIGIVINWLSNIWAIYLKKTRN